jgi:hypothetical protein
VFQAGGRPTLGSLMSVQVIAPLLALSMLSLIPLVYHAWRRSR